MEATVIAPKDLATRDELLRTAVAHAPQLTRFFRGQAPHAHDAQDLMQELYLAVLKMRGSQSIGHPKAYLFTVAANLAHQHRQRANARPHIRLDDATDQQKLSLSGGPKEDLPESAADLAQSVSQLWLALSELSPKVRAAVIWRHRDGYTCDEIAKKLSVVGHRVKKYLVKGVAHCRASHGGAGSGELARRKRAPSPVAAVLPFPGHQSVGMR